MSTAVMQREAVQAVPSARLLPWEENPNGLLSLWDMKTFHASILITDLIWLQIILGDAGKDDETFKSKLDHVLNGIVDTSNRIGFDNIAAQAARLKKHIGGNSPISGIVALGGELLGSIQHEYLHKCFLYVPNADKMHLEANQFSFMAVAKFPSASYDMFESGKCFALDRHTACVFHLMRVLEIGLKALCVKLDYIPKNDNWHEVLKELPEAIRKKFNPHIGNPNWKEEEHFYSQLAVEFRHFKNAWRNYVMHAHEKYGRDEADAIYAHVKSFIDHAASQFSEPGVV